MHIMVCVSGFSGVGKDEFCKHLVQKHGAIQTGLADPAKRHMHDVYGFTEEQLFGPSKFRNGGDLRYPKKDFFNYKLFKSKKHGVWVSPIVTDPNGKLIKLNNKEHLVIDEGDPKFWLSPREALQKYCELMNNLYPNTWIDKGIQIQRKLASGGFKYSKIMGVYELETELMDPFVTCFSDFRHENEICAVRLLDPKSVKVVLVRIKSKKISEPPFLHKSETEQVKIPDSDFDFIVNNDGTIDDLHENAEKIVTHLK